MSHLVGTLILLGILMFIVYRILQTLNNQTQYSSQGSGEGGKVYHMPERRAPAPPRSISLETVPEEQNPFTSEECEEAIGVLTDKGGIEFIGAYSVKQMPGYFLGAFTHPRQSLIGILYKDPKDQTWVNLISEYEDGRIITTSGAEDVSKAPRPKGMPLFSHPGLPIEQLLRRHKLETRASKKKPAKPADQFSQFFADNYARLRESQRAWRSWPKIFTTRSISIFICPKAPFQKMAHRRGSLWPRP